MVIKGQSILAYAKLTHDKTNVMSTEQQNASCWIY